MWILQRLGRRDSGVGNELVALFNAELGEGVYSPRKLEQDLGDESVALIAATDDQGLVGGALARLLDDADREYYAHFGERSSSVFDAGEVCSLEQLAVAERGRRQGLGTRLTEAATAWAASQGCAGCITISWISGRAGASAGLFGRLGWSPGPQVADFYLEESTRDRWTCPVCGGPCRCPARVFTYALTRRASAAQ
jgi:GNAT superfamily N-acetyltransferase